MKRNVNGFTLIELLAVIIILAIVALIATPIILDVIKDAKDEAMLRTMDAVVDGGKQLCANAMFNEEIEKKLDGSTNLYNEIIMSGKKPLSGKLVINSNCEISLKIIENNKCYVKYYKTDIEVKEVSSCDDYIGEDNDVPTIKFEVDKTKFNELGWAKEDFYIKAILEDSLSGIREYSWCSNTNECESSVVVNTSGEQLINVNMFITNESSTNKVCLKVIDRKDNEILSCSDDYKLDKTVPTLTAKSDAIEITVGDSVDTSTYFNTPVYGISGGSISCNPANTSSLVIGNKTVTCTATSGSGLITKIGKNILIKKINAIGDVFYFNPVDNLKCDNYVETNSNIGVREGCLKWYIYKIEEDSIGLLLDHNLSNPIKSSNSLPSVYDAYQFLVNTLNSYTNIWQPKARFINLEEVKAITGNTTFAYNTEANGYHFDNNLNLGTGGSTCTEADISKCKYGWLYDRTSIKCKDYNCPNNILPIDSYNYETSGYWIGTIKKNTSNISTGVLVIDQYARIYNHLPSGYARYAIRPIIIIPKSIIS